ncbi:hypothetical protein P280DRAFT_251496 [Massarina eburnea CBS 473.64]|uniref:Uncharacterized protein n=1 Tax=Massarina eburnea CBS 473.64 TaxID=1395130 RepID=A0A6A6S716_9PLEO|nr:hypothetical protein P280DRAFT_251496 [Massarina eburnea CBS 473.64]
MCFCFPFGLSNNKKRKSSSSGEKKRWDRTPPESLRGDGRGLLAEVEEKRASAERSKSKRSRESPRRERDEFHQQYNRANEDVYRSRAQYRTPMHVEVPDVCYRSVDANSSQETLLNPRRPRSQQHKQKHASQHTLRGHGKRVNSKNVRENPGGWSLFAPSSPKTAKRRDHRHYQTLDSSPRSQRSHRQHHSTYDQDSPESSRPQRHHRSRQHQNGTHRQATPNTSARRDPDRRFAVLAATNTALEDLRREAFAQSSPPPRRERLRRYQGVTIPASSVPYSWDCVSSQTSNGAGYADPSSRHRRRR